MKPTFCNFRQHSAEWFAARLGKPTASRFDDLITPEGKPRKGQTPASYRNQLVVERLTRNPYGTMLTHAMQRGTELEPRARAWYELERDTKVVQVGWCYDEDAGGTLGRWGCSPDGLVGEDGLIEIKCPSLAAVMDALLTGEAPRDHAAQVQGQLWGTGRAWCDLLIYAPEAEIAPQVFRVERDDEFIGALSEIVPEFADSVDAAETLAIDRGCRRGLDVDLSRAAAPDPTENWGKDGVVIPI